MYPAFLSSTVLMPESQILGPVEELHAKFEEEERRDTRFRLLHDEAYNFVMGDLPVLGDTTRVGFHNVAVMLLGSYNHDAAADLVRQAKWSFHQLLTATDAQLQEVGMRFTQQRRRVLKMVQEFHQSQWFTLDSLRLPDKTKPLEMRGLLEVAARLCVHLYVDCSTVVWLSHHIPAQAKARRALRKHLDDSLAAAAEVVAIVQHLFNDSRKKSALAKMKPVDFIGPRPEKPEPFFTKPLVVSLTIGAVTLIALHQLGLQVAGLSPLLTRLRPALPWCLA